MRVELPVIEAGLIVGEIDLKAKKINLEGSTPIKFNCISSADCCSNLKIPVTDFDIQRIEVHDYAMYQIVQDQSPQLRLPKTKFGNIEKNYWIKSNPYTGTCTFLEDNLCKIHEFKPFVCRIFPFSLEFVDVDHVIVKIHSSNLCKNVSVDVSTDSDNESHLEDLLITILAEEAFRDQYFKKYGDNV